MPRCKICKDKFEPRHFLQKACFKAECLAEWSKADRVKKTKAIQKVKIITEKGNKKARLDLDRKSLKWQHKHTQVVFNKLRRLQELK